MKKRVLAAIATSALCLPALSIACTEPSDKPTIPDPATAVTAQMIKANNEVKAYVKQTEEYLSCSNLSRSQANEKLEALKAFANKFNLAIRAFKAKNGG